MDQFVRETIFGVLAEAHGERASRREKQSREKGWDRSGRERTDYGEHIPDEGGEPLTGTVFDEPPDPDEMIVKPDLDYEEDAGFEGPGGWDSAEPAAGAADELPKVPEEDPDLQMADFLGFGEEPEEPGFSSKDPRGEVRFPDYEGPPHNYHTGRDYYRHRKPGEAGYDPKRPSFASEYEDAGFINPPRSGEWSSRSVHTSDQSRKPRPFRDPTKHSRKGLGDE